MSVPLYYIKLSSPSPSPSPSSKHIESRSRTRMQHKKDRAVVMVEGRSKDEEGKKKIEKLEVPKTRNPETIRYIEKKMTDKGILRMDRHPVDGLGQGPPKSGHGGKYTWEGPVDTAEAELDPVPPAIDPNDPNYVDDEQQQATDNVIVGEVEVAKVAEAKEGVSRIEVQPTLKPVLETE